MLNKKMVTSVILLGMMGLGYGSQAFASEGDSQTIDGLEGNNSAEVITRGNLGKIDNEDPDVPIPDGDDKWIKVTLPTEVVFGSENQETITSPSNYTIENKSGRPVKVDVEKYSISGGNGVQALTELNINRTAGEQGNSTVNLVSGQAEVKDYTINQEFVRLANNEGKIGDETTGKAKATNFNFTGKVDKNSLAKEKNYVESKLSFKFTALRMDGQTVEEAHGTSGN